jgi:riboflavin kinase/FMN adenylyltransferase
LSIYRFLTQIPTLKPPISLTVGVFDGVHLGHKALLKELTSNHGSSVVLTFSNHPSEIFNPGEKKQMLTTVEEKCALFKSLKVDHVVILPFTKEIAEMSYQMFLEQIHRSLPFHYLYIGENDAFGKNRQGTKEAIVAFAPTLGFSPRYVPKLKDGEEIISSTLIRKYLKAGKKERAEALLGHKLLHS